ncbi:MAG: hypothetical protein RL497_2814, partial [Pseudomonadota bacterium]
DLTKTRLSSQNNNSTTELMACSTVGYAYPVFNCFIPSSFESQLENKKILNADIQEFFSNKKYSLRATIKSPIGYDPQEYTAPTEDILKSQYHSNPRSFSWEATQNNNFDYTQIQLEAKSRKIAIKLFAPAANPRLVLPELPSEFQLDPLVAARTIELIDIAPNQSTDVNDITQLSASYTHLEHFSVSNTIDLGAPEENVEAQNFALRFIDRSKAPNQPVAGVHAWVYAEDNTTVLKEAISDAAGMAEFGPMPASLSFAFKDPKVSSNDHIAINYEKNSANTGVKEYSLWLTSADCANAEHIEIIAKSPFGSIDKIAGFYKDDHTLFPYTAPELTPEGDLKQQFAVCGALNNDVPNVTGTNLQAKIGANYYSGQLVSKQDPSEKNYEIIFDAPTTPNQVNINFINYGALLDPIDISGLGLVVGDSFSLDNFLTFPQFDKTYFNVWAPTALLESSSQHYVLFTRFDETSYQYTGHYSKLATINERLLALMPYNKFTTAEFKPGYNQVTWKTFNPDVFTTATVTAEYFSSKIFLRLNFPPNDNTIILPKLPTNYALVDDPTAPPDVRIGLRRDVDEALENPADANPLSGYLAQLKKRDSYEIETGAKTVTEFSPSLKAVRKAGNLLPTTSTKHNLPNIW